MGFWGTVIGGIIGAACGGHWFVGGIIGNAVGELLNKGSEAAPGCPSGGKRTADSTADSNALLSAHYQRLFRCMGKLAKANGHVSEDEIHFVSSVMDHLKFRRSERRLYQDAFRSGRDSSMSFTQLVNDFACSAFVIGVPLPTRRAYVEMFCCLAMADGPVDTATMAVLHQAEQLLRATGTADAFFSRQRQRQPNGSTLEECYKCLGVSPNATDAEVKRAWRTLIRKYHPDRIAGSDLPQDFKDYATRHSQEINAAYEEICKARGIT